MTTKKFQPKTRDELKELVTDETIYLGDIDTSLITYMKELFSFSKREDFSGIETWDVSHVKNMSWMFYGAKFFNHDISKWDVSNVTTMRGMFRDSQFNQDISKWNVSKVECMDTMFDSSKFNGDISNWDVSKVKDMRSMFGCSNFNGDISNWDVSNVTDMGAMFAYSKFNGDISKWNVSNVECMCGMFDHSKFNGDISKWKLRESVNTCNMLRECNILKITLPEELEHFKEEYNGKKNLIKTINDRLNHYDEDKLKCVLEYMIELGE